MPDFGDYSYFFAIEVMHITLFQIGMGTVIVGFTIILGPILYQKYCIHSEFRKLFFVAQTIHIV